MREQWIPGPLFRTGLGTRLPLNRTASDGKLGAGLGTRLINIGLLLEPGAILGSGFPRLILGCTFLVLVKLTMYLLTLTDCCKSGINVALEQFTCATTFYAYSITSERRTCTSGTGRLSGCPLLRGFLFAFVLPLESP